MCFLCIKNHCTEQVKSGKGNNMAFEPITTQEQLDNVIKDRITRAEESVKKGFEGWLSPEAVEGKLGDLRADLTSANNELAKANEKAKGYEADIAERDKRIKAYETTTVKSRIAHEMGLSYEATEFIKGETEEDIRKSAGMLKGLMGSGSGTPSYRPPKDSGVDGENDAYKKMLEEMKGE